MTDAVVYFRLKTQNYKVPQFTILFPQANWYTRIGAKRRLE